MDKNGNIKEILEAYEDISVISDNGELVIFLLQEKEYGCWYGCMKNDSDSPIFLAKNEEKYDYPHILPTGIPLDKDKKDKFRYICLYENDSSIRFMQSKKEKVQDGIERLLRLVSLSKLEQEKEFQKEFLFYWNSAASKARNVCLYIDHYKVLQKMNAYCNIDGEVRFVSAGMKLNDANVTISKQKKWKHMPQLPVFYIPIIDKRRVLPPTNGRNWISSDIMQIIEGKEFNRISYDSYQCLQKCKIKSKKMGLIFEMNVEGNSITFAMIIEFSNSKNDTVLNKLKRDMSGIEPIKSRRMDYFHLSRQIGNEVSLFDKKVLLIGAGSLGSYTARELVRAGVRNITIYDGDELEAENILRHASGQLWIGCKKVHGIKYELERIHPEIHINAIDNNIDELTILEETKKADVAIFTVGSSDVQWCLNKVLKEAECKKPILFVWLEAGGVYSHILSINYTKKGCFQCLYTNEEGEWINNKANQTQDSEIDKYKIRNGCGATRVAYGNSILLRTASAILDTIQDVITQENQQNYLVNISHLKTEKIEGFAEKECTCCGGGNIQEL